MDAKPTQFHPPAPLVMRLRRVTGMTPLHCKQILSGVPTEEQERYVADHEECNSWYLLDPLGADPAYAAIFAEVARDASALTEAYVQECQRDHDENGSYFSTTGLCHYYWGRMQTLLLERYGLEWKTPAQMSPGLHID
jgi:hypothetical protein